MKHFRYGGIYDDDYPDEKGWVEITPGFQGWTIGTCGCRVPWYDDRGKLYARCPQHGVTGIQFREVPPEEHSRLYYGAILPISNSSPAIRCTNTVPKVGSPPASTEPDTQRKYEPGER